MSDDWLQSAEELRKQNHPANAEDAAIPKGDKIKFYQDNVAKVDKILAALGKTWKSLDPHRPGVLGLGRHPGNDYQILYSKYRDSLDLCLFDKSNVNRKWAGAGRQLQDSLRVEFGSDYFILKLPNYLRVGHKSE